MATLTVLLADAERLIFDHLWIDDSEYVADSKVRSNPFANQWSFADSTELEKWSQMLHVDVWGIAQEIQRKGVESEFILLEIAKRDSGRRVWPVSLVRHPAPNQASSSAVEMALDGWAPACVGKALWSTRRALVKTGQLSSSPPESLESIP